MPHGFRTDIDTGDRLKFSKRHKDGALTEVDITRRVPGEDFELTVRDPRGNLNLGTFGTLGDARERAKRWMRDHPKGVPAEDNGIAGAGGGIPGMNGDTLF